MEHRTALGIFLALAIQRPVATLNGRASFVASSGNGTARRRAASRRPGFQTTSASRASTSADHGSSGAVASVAVSLVDVDANLLHPALVYDVDHHIQIASSVGVSQLVVPGSTLEDSRGALELALRKPKVIFPTAGVHPYHVEEVGPLEDAIKVIADLAANEEVRCVGECGLDYSEGFPAAELQLPWFERQVQLACELRKPLFLHERQAFGQFTEVLRRYDSMHGLPPCLVHCFTGTAEELAVYVEMGFFVGITGFICKGKRGEALRAAVKHVPLNRLMVETDAPYLGFPGCREGHSKPKQQNPNVPSALPAVVRALSECLGLPFDEVARATAQNSRAFFKIEEVL